jgi:hypothetical protein
LQSRCLLWERAVEAVREEPVSPRLLCQVYAKMQNKCEAQRERERHSAEMRVHVEKK